MKAVELKKEVDKRVKEALRKKIFERAYAVAKELVKPKREMHNFWTQEEYSFSFEDGEFMLRIWSYWGPLGTHFLHVYTHQGEVFAGLKDGKEIKIDTYISGEWERRLNVKKLRAKISGQRTAAYQHVERQLRETEQNRPPNSEEKARAECFGIKV